jgi:hypothetical protein
MRQTFTVAGKLTSVSAIALALVFLVAPDVGKCLAEDKDEAKATIRVVRPNYLFVGILVTMNVYVDEVKYCSVINGETKTFSIAAKKGTRKLSIRNNLKEDFKPAEESIEILPGAVIVVDVDGDADGIHIRKVTFEKKGVWSKPEVNVLGVKLDGVLEEKVLASETVETPKGVEQEYEISMTIERSVSFSETLAAELGAKLDLKVFEGEIRGKIERQESQTFKQSETVRRNLKLNGAVAPKVKVIWIGTFRKGTATVYWNGAEKKIPFSFQVGLRPQVTVIKD